MQITKEDFRAGFESLLFEKYSRLPQNCTPSEIYIALAEYVADSTSDLEVDTFKRHFYRGSKRVYYFSMEFLIGPLLDNYLLNLGIRKAVADGLWDMGISFDEVCSCEPDPALGNGGLGRLAACFLDSMAALDIAGTGMGLRYKYGLFRQRIESGYQIEEPDNWLKNGWPWETVKPSESVVVRFGGTVDRYYEDGKLKFNYSGYEKVKAVPYDVPIIGFGGETVNQLRLWRAQPEDDIVDLEAFDRGDYSAGLRSQSNAEALTYFLYPNDTHESGRVLRLKQEYFLVCAGISNIMRTYRDEYGDDRWGELGQHVSIHINDTHPALCVPELMRVLMDEKGMEWDDAWKTTCEVMSFTNHTVLPEALEKWPQDSIKQLLPRVYMIIEEIDRRWQQELRSRGEDFGRVHRSTAILWGGEARMADLSIIGSHSVNGVAGLHSEILKNDLFRDFARIHPEKFNNKTNGISHRRFLIQSNPDLTELITEAIGPGWITGFEKLAELKQYSDDHVFIDKLLAVKRVNKLRLSAYIGDAEHILVDPDSVFDVQVKRIHAYKRQLMNAFKVLDLYMRLKEDPHMEINPYTFIFAGKAAPGYAFAKEVIKFVCSIADMVNSDKTVNDKIKVVFVENFRISNAQLIYPAADIGEQISTAGKEASGTGNMKFMMNGAICLGTLDGANIEIRDLAGAENFQLFGMTAEEVAQLRMSGGYDSQSFAESKPEIKRLLDSLTGGFFPAGTSFWGIHDAMIRQNDEYFVLRDFDSYKEAWLGLDKIYSDRQRFGRMSLANIAGSAFFSSDRTIREYAEDIWHI